MGWDEDLFALLDDLDQQAVVLPQEDAAAGALRCPGFCYGPVPLSHGLRGHCRAAA